MGSAGSDMLRDATHGRRVVLVTATDTEAEPLRAALLNAEQHVVATKTLFLGELEVAPAHDVLGTAAPATGLAAAPAGATAARAAAPGPAAAGGARVGGARSTVPVVLAIGGCDKANAAHILTCLFQAMRPAPLLALQAGIAGAFPTIGPGPGAEIGDIVLATREAYSDTGSSSPDGWLSAAELGLPISCVDGAEMGGVFPIDVDLVDAAGEAIAGVDWPGVPPAVHRGPCVTSSRATGLRAEAETIIGRWGALAESMEGASAAHICALYRVPFLEIRGISNLVGDRDRETWQVDRAVAVAGRAALAVVAALPDLPLATAEGAARRGDG